MPQLSIGSRVRCSVGFTASGVYADPDAIVLIVKQADGAHLKLTYGVGPEVVRDSMGKYHYDLSITPVPGRWHVRWEGTGALVAVVDTELEVLPSRFY